MRRDTALLFGSSLGFALWGFYSYLFIVTLWTVRSNGTNRLSSAIMMAIISVYVVNLLLIAIELWANYYTFMPTAPPSEITSTVLAILADGCTNLALAISDAALVWRLFVIYAEDYRVIVIKLTRGPLPESLEARRQASGLALICISLGLNWLITGLIVGRLWWADRELRESYASSDTPPASSYTRITVALVESGILYSALLACYLIANYAGNGYGQYILTGSISIVVGIVPMLIQLQRSLGYLQPHDKTPAGHISRSYGAQSTGIHFAPRLGTHTGISTFQSRTVRNGKSDLSTSGNEKARSTSLLDSKADDLA